MTFKKENRKQTERENKPKRGVKSTNPMSRYNIRQRTFDLSPSDLIAAKKLADDLVVSLQLKAEVAMQEDLVLRRLSLPGREEEFDELTSRVLIEIKKIIANMSQL